MCSFAILGNLSTEPLWFHSTDGQVLLIPELVDSISSLAHK